MAMGPRSDRAERSFEKKSHEGISILPRVIVPIGVKMMEILVQPGDK